MNAGASDFILLLSQIALWDTQGQERYNSMTSNYFRMCQAMILVYDPLNPATITPLRFWIDNCYRYNPISDMLVLSLWANYSKTGIVDTYMKSAEINGLMQDYNILPSLQFNVSTLNGEGIMDAFNHVIETVISITGPHKQRSDTIIIRTASTCQYRVHTPTNDESKQKCSCR